MPPDQLLWTVLPIIILLAIGLISFGPRHDSSGLKGPDGIGKRAKDNRSGIVSLSYSYDDSIGGGAYSFRVDSGEGGRTFSCEYMAFPDYGEMSCSIGEDVIRELEAIYADCRLAEWDGYHRYAEGVNDGWGFSLSIGFANGKSMSAGGSNCSPEGYAFSRTG